MLIWQGWGIMVVGIVIGCSLMVYALLEAITGSTVYWRSHDWPVGVTLLVAGVLCWATGPFLSQRNAKILLDPQTGKQVVVGESHTFFFMPVHWWGPILGVLGMWAIVNEWLK